MCGGTRAYKVDSNCARKSVCKYLTFQCLPQSIFAALCAYDPQNWKHRPNVLVTRKPKFMYPKQHFESNQKVGQGVVAACLKLSCHLIFLGKKYHVRRLPNQ